MCHFVSCNYQGFNCFCSPAENMTERPFCAPPSTRGDSPDSRICAEGIVARGHLQECFLPTMNAISTRGAGAVTYITIKAKKTATSPNCSQVVFPLKTLHLKKSLFICEVSGLARVIRLVHFHGPIPLLIIFALFTMPVLFLQVSRRAGFLAWCCGSDKAHSCKSSSIDVNYSLELSTSTWESPVLTTSHRLSWLSWNTTNQTGGSNWRLTGPTLSCRVLLLWEGILQCSQGNFPHRIRSWRMSLELQYKECMKIHPMKNRNPFNVWTE